MKSFMVVLTLFVSVAVSAVSAQQPKRIWITDVTIISPENLDHITTGSVLIEGDRIARVERKAGIKTPAGATVVSGKGQFLIPGLIDSHVHLAVVPGVPYEKILGPEADKPAMFKDYFRQLPRSYLYFGYTTLIDLAVIDRHALDDFREAPLHPDVYDCGGSLPVANGYPMMFAPPATRFKLFPNFIYDPAQASAIPAEYKPQDHTPAGAVARVKSSGGICVKTYFEHGFGTDRNLPVPTPEMAAEIRKAATTARLVLMMHANSLEAQKFAVDAGVDVIAHGLWNWGEYYKQPELPPEMKPLLDQIAERHIGYQPTIQVMAGLRAYFDPEYLHMEAIPKVIPASLLDWFKSPEGKWFKKEISFGDVPDATAREQIDRGPIRRVRQVVAYLASKNANFLFGTDTPSAPTYGNLPGLNGYLEMQQLKDAGMSLAQIFRAATINNARAFKLDSQLGTIEPGKIANLVLLKESPLESITGYDSISAVIVQGKLVQREKLEVGAK
jgi:imidazolonepropionase-like amidohydrolase